MGNAQLWLVISDEQVCVAAVITFIIGSKCHIAACGGTLMKSWIHLLDEIEEWAALEQGCQAIAICGRKGWLKTLSAYRIRGYVLEKDL